MFKMAELSADFKIDPPGPLSYESDEESFVVLGKSLINDVDDTPMESNDQIAHKTVEDAKKIIDEEIKKLSATDVKAGGEFIGSKSFTLQMQQSVHLNDTTVVETNIGEKNNNFPEMEVAFKSLNISQDPSTSKTFIPSEASHQLTSFQMHENQLVEEKNKKSISEQSSLAHLATEKQGDVNSMTLKDLQKMIAQIVEENTQLRKTLEQNNIKMREQCNRIAEWQNEVKKVHDVHKEKILEAKEHIDKLTREKNESKNEALALQDELNVTRTKLAEIQIVQTEMQQSRSTAYATIKSLNAEVDRLQGIIKKLQQKETNDEKIFVLETQLELFKKDFEEERRLKEALREEKEKMSEDIQNLQRRNQQLQERVEMIADKDFVMYETTRDSPRSSRSSTEGVLKCPKCNSAFHDMPSLQNHCYICIT